jgi:hypothetical protein
MERSTSLYQFRYRGKKEWEDISEISLLKGLQEIFERVTPAIQQILDGKQVETLSGVYRLKVQYP